MPTNKENRYTAADALTDALVKAGVSHIFINTGTDYTPVIESWAKYEEKGLPKPKIVICPHEMVALSAAQGYAQATGQAQAVFVHVDVGTQNLGGSVHNAYRCRMPAFIFAGVSPITLEGEMKGTRSSPIHYFQNVNDQAGIVREYTKWYYEVRTGKNIQQLVYRGLQIAHSDPQGPIYMMAAREILEEDSRNIEADMDKWRRINFSGLTDEAVKQVTKALLEAEKPVILTSYLGRNPDSVAELVALSEHLAIPVVEVFAQFMNFPADHPLHAGCKSQPYIEEADLILVLDSDLPWIPSAARPNPKARIIYLDVDPLKENTPLWYIPADQYYKVNSFAALKQINKRLAEAESGINLELVESRHTTAAAAHQQRMLSLRSSETMQDVMTPEFIAATLNEVLGEDDIILDETTSYQPLLEQHIHRTKPGTKFMSGGSALGWFGGAAIGVKLANPDKNVVALAGDGTYIFSVPTATHWVANKYKTPFMTVIFNNQGWGAAQLAAAREHPEGYAVTNDTFWTSISPQADLEQVARAAGDAFVRVVTKPDDLKSDLLEGLDAINQGRCAVINIMMPPISNQVI